MVDSNIISAYDQGQLDALLHSGYKLTPATLANRITDGRWIAAPHLLHASTEVSHAINLGGKFVIVTMPPRHGKSEFLSVHTPIWFLETYPHLQVMLASYGAELATEFALKVRDSFQNEDLHPLLNTRLRKDKQRVDNFKTTKGGGMISIGVGGSATGKGAHLFLIDDFIKNAEEALSESQKQKLWEWFLSTAFTRLEPNATIIVLATRWDRNDLIGMILDKFEELAELGFERPVVINLPALARPNDPLGRAVGEPLWAQRYDLNALLRIKAMLGTYWWEALYQQDPPHSMGGAALGGKLKFINADQLPHRSQMKSVRIWDLAATDGGGDYTAGPLMHLHKETGHVYISDCRHEQKGPAGVEALVEGTAEFDGPGVPIWIEQEPGSAGKNLVEHYIHEILPLFSVRGEKATGPIEVRAQPFLAGVEAGNVICVKGKWNAKLVDELDGFPNAEHDDIITACALGYRKLLRGRFGGIIWGRRNREGRKAAINTGDVKRRRMGVVW